MKDFVMLFIGSDYQELGLSLEEVQSRMGKWMAWGEKMGKAGVDPRGNALKPEAKTVSGPDRVVSDGPFAEVKDLIGGYWVVKANNFEEVVEIAQDYPDYDLGGTVEIREIMVF